MSTYITVSPNIIVCPNQPPGFTQSIQQAISKISSKPVGRRLLEKIGAAKHVVWITFGNASETTFYEAIGAVTPRVGSDAEIRLSQVTRAMIGIDGREAESPFFIDFAHELIHVKNGFYGKNRSLGKLACKELWQDDDEYQTTVGFPSKKNKQRTSPKITENAIRQEHGIKKIYSHLFASELEKPGIALKVKLESVANSVNAVFLDLLADNEFLTNPRGVFFIASQPNTPDEFHLKNLEDLKDNLVIVRTNPHSTPPILGKIHQVSNV